MKTSAFLAITLVLLLGCHSSNYVSVPNPTDGQIAHGRDIFFNETFNGNGRVCASCHGINNNLTINPNFIASLPPTDPLFVAESNADLKENFENPRLMRHFGLIIENLDGFDSLDTKFTLRGVPHLLGLSSSIDSQDGPRTGWSGDGAPGDGSLRAFATGAVIQHFSKTLNRVSGVDFRLPTEEELDALEAFQLSLGRQQDLQLPLSLKDSSALRGQAIFNDPTSGKCFACHDNAGANANPGLFGENAGNMNFNTGVENLPDQPQDLTGELVPPDDGFQTPGDGTFNTPPLVEAADTPPFFHNNSIKTLEGAIAFYNGDSFNNSPAGQLIVNATGSGINLDATQVDAVAAFLRLINALENIRRSTELLKSFVKNEFLGDVAFDDLTFVAAEEVNDAIMVLSEANLQPRALIKLRNAIRLVKKANNSYPPKRDLIKKALAQLENARNELIKSN